MRPPAVRFALSLLALGLAGAAPSESSDLGRGAIELNPSLTYSHNSFSGFAGTDLTTTTVDVSGLIGYFVSDMVELGGGVLVSYESLDYGGPGSAVSATAAGLIGGVALNFPTSGNLVPFVRGSAGFVSNSGDLYVDNATTVIAPLLEGGLRVMVGESASVNFVVGYQHRSNAFGVQNQSVDSVTLGVGVSVYPALGK
jgi:hypothetical protein